MYKLKKYKILSAILGLLFVLLLSTIACKQKESQLQYDTSFRLSGSNKPPVDFKENDPGFRYIYNISKGVFNGSVNIKNNAPIGNKYRILAFLDYRQAHFIFGDNISSSHKLFLKSGQQVIKKFSVSIPKGQHTIALIALEETNGDLVNLLNMQLNDYAIGNRFIIKYGGESKLAKYPKLESRVGKKADRLISIEKNSGEIILKINWSKIKSQNLVILPFSNYKQMGTYLLKNTGKKTYTVLPINPRKGIATVVAFENPFDNSLKSLQASGIYQSNRILLK